MINLTGSSHIVALVHMLFVLTLNTRQLWPTSWRVPTFNHPWIFRCWIVSIQPNKCQLNGVETLRSLKSKTLTNFYPPEKRTNGPTHLRPCLLRHFTSGINFPFGFVKIKSAMEKLVLSGIMVFSVHNYFCLTVCLPVCLDVDDNVISLYDVNVIFYTWSICNDDKCIFLVISRNK